MRIYNRWLLNVCGAIPRSKSRSRISTTRVSAKVYEVGARSASATRPSRLFWKKLAAPSSCELTRRTPTVFRYPRVPKSSRSSPPPKIIIKVEQASCGCILIDAEKIQVITRSPHYRNHYVHKRNSMSLIGIPQDEINRRKQIGLVVDDFDDDDDDGVAYLDDSEDEDDVFGGRPSRSAFPYAPLPTASRRR